jgi:hypothetical protein
MCDPKLEFCWSRMKEKVNQTDSNFTVGLCYLRRDCVLFGKSVLRVAGGFVDASSLMKLGASWLNLIDEQYTFIEGDLENKKTKA